MRRLGNARVGLMVPCDRTRGSHRLAWLDLRSSATVKSPPMKTKRIDTSKRPTLLLLAVLLGIGFWAWSIVAKVYETPRWGIWDEYDASAVAFNVITNLETQRKTK